MKNRNSLGIAVVALAGLAIVAFFAMKAPDTAQPPISVEAVPIGQLGGAVQPTSYRLDLNIDPREQDFSGTVEIDAVLAGAADHIWLHGKSIVVESSMVITGGEVVPAIYEQLDDTGVAKLTLEREVPAGPITIKISYKAPFDRALEGLYRVDEGGDAYAFTQFEATSARLAFPGFDEPAFKTPFDVTMVVPAGSAAIANTPMTSEENAGEGFTRITFARSKPMPTYLLAFAVGPLDVVEWADIPATDLRPNPIPLRGVAARGKGDQLRFILESSAAVTTALEEYFRTPYPYAKLDLLAVPDFAAGAMENIGAITYREQAILVNESTTLGRKRRIIGTHSHELAHQWFGDLVTPVWWDDIWLNEAFATWSGRKGANRAFPEFDYTSTAVSSVINAMAADSRASARQIRNPVKSNLEIGDAFDGITYQKGASVLAMFEQYVGPEKFRKGITLHFERFAHSVATLDDFLQSVSDGANDPDFVEAFKTFLLQPGLPILRISYDRGDNGTATVRLRQDRYLPVGTSAPGDPLWQIPVCLRFVGSDDGERCFLMTDRETEVVFDDVGNFAALIPNSGAKGYYRFSLDADGWRELSGVTDQMSAGEKRLLKDSLYGAFRADAIGVGSYMAIAAKLAADRDWAVATSSVGDLNNILNRVASDDSRQSIRNNLVEIYGPRLEAIGLRANSEADQDDPAGTAFLRNTLVGFLALSAESEPLRQELLAAAQDYVGYDGDGEIKPDALDSSLVDTALSVAVQELGEPFVEVLLERFRASNDATLRQNILTGITASDDPEVGALAREMALTQDVRANEMSQIIFGLSFNTDQGEATTAWVESNLDAVLSRIPSWRHGGIIVTNQGSCEPERAEAVRAYYEPLVDKLEGGRRFLAQTLETIQVCAAIRGVKGGEVDKYFQDLEEEPRS